jgi:cell fate regulator YaaT (PSP1 superfamily)
VGKYLGIYGKPRYLGIIKCDEELKKGDITVVESHRGDEFAIVAGEITDEQDLSYRQLKNSIDQGDGGPKNYEPVVTDLKFVSIASQSDLDEVERYRMEENSVLELAKDMLYDHDLDMKLIDVEYLLKKRKLFFYFSSEQRVDFRSYVRDLAREFKTRIELRQVGVRDEAKIIKGLGPCGQPCCCSYWLYQFAPICIRMVKEQNLALNPAKISGLCGRLMCCMHYEHNSYHEMWKDLPNPGSKIKTPNGNVIVAGVDLSNNSVRCMVPGRGELKIPRDKFDEFRETIMAGREWEEDKKTVPFIQEDYEEKDKKEPNEDEQGERSDKRSRRPRRDKTVNRAEKGTPEGEGPAGDSPRKKKRRRKPRKPKIDGRAQNQNDSSKGDNQRKSDRGADGGGDRKIPSKKRQRRPRSRRSNRPAPKKDNGK